MKLFAQKIITLILIVFLFNHCSKDDSEINSEETYLKIFSEIWIDFDQIYPYFLHKNIDWDSVYNVYSSKINENTTEAEFSDLIGEMTMSLKDVHVNLSTPYNNYRYSGFGLYHENPPDNAINYLENITIDNHYVTFSDVKNTNYAYLRIKNFTGDISSYESAISKLNEISAKDGLIIDIRSNPGGNEAIGWEFAGNLSNLDKLYRYSRYRNGPGWGDFGSWNPMSFKSKTNNAFDKKIILLTNRYIYSSAELFTLMMKTLPNVTSVGDTTFGASANPKEYTYNNNWKCRISRWQLANRDYKLIQDVGIAPDYCIEMTENSIAEGKDLILEKAIELLNK